MIELLILFALKKSVLTMYGISKEIKKTFSVFTTPSYGTIKPALIRLENGGYIKSQKTISKGGRPSVYYSINSAGETYLKQLILEPPIENPMQFITISRIKLICADLLSDTEQLELFSNLMEKAQNILYDAQNLIKDKDLSFYPRIVFDNIVCEYKNFISMLEEFEHVGRGK